ncbi:MAG: ATP-binding cassette domain-containing protein [Oscillospiraceae bacterium]|jgi:putative ABC transport system ATP-binding protein|nr:ATP-binding cassette domain-containing protein [Oscillospiraceae bacterium]
MIKIEHLTKKFGERVLFEDFDLDIADGEFVIFSGVSGSGKTTLLNMVGALEPVASGKIFVDGTDVSVRRNQLRYFSETAGFLFQNFALIEDKTVAENLNIVRKTNRSGVSVDDALARVGLSDKRDSKVYTLSGGEQQRAALARLMIKKCRLILADEPTGSLDRANADAVMAILRELNDSGKTVIVVTHDEGIKRSGGRVVEIDN